MSRCRTVFAISGLAAVTGFAALSGGWAVVSLDTVPDHLIAGAPTTLTYTVRQHGQNPIDDLRGQIVARSGKETVKVATTARGKGRYAASLTVPREGDWTITAHSGFGPSDITLLPIAAVGANVRPVALSEAERGRRLFVGKGCVTCHSNGALAGGTVKDYGGDLTGRRFPADYLARLLKDPRSVAASRPKLAEMPSLDLRQTEIAALTAFINAERAVTIR